MGDGVPNNEPHIIFEPTTGNLTFRLQFASHMDLTRTQHNDVRAVAITAGGMSNVTAAYDAIRSELDSIDSGRDTWLDRQCEGADATETGLLRRAVVWDFVSRGDIPSPPTP